jgi:hypothetical protein
MERPHGITWSGSGCIALKHDTQTKDRLMNKDYLIKKHATGYTLARSARDMEIADRSRITAALKEQRMKRDAEIAALGPTAKKPARATKLKVA